MADLRSYQTRAAGATRADASIDEGLRAYMLRVYNLMALGLAITAPPRSAPWHSPRRRIRRPRLRHSPTARC